MRSARRRQTGSGGDVALASRLGAGGPSAEAFHRVVVFTAVTPTDGDFVSDGLNVGGIEHGGFHLRVGPENIMVWEEGLPG